MYQHEHDADKSWWIIASSSNRMHTNLSVISNQSIFVNKFPFTVFGKTSGQGKYKAGWFSAAQWCKSCGAGWFRPSGKVLIKFVCVCGFLSLLREKKTTKSIISKYMARAWKLIGLIYGFLFIQVAEKMSFIEQFKMERERQQKVDKWTVWIIN